MKNILVIIAAILAIGISGCASKKAEACSDGTSCCAKTPTKTPKHKH